MIKKLQAMWVWKRNYSQSDGRETNKTVLKEIGE